MAASEDPFEDVQRTTKVPDTQSDTQWRPGEAVMVRGEPPVDRADWFKALLALFGRRAPVSPA